MLAPHRTAVTRVLPLALLLACHPKTRTPSPATPASDGGSLAVDKPRADVALRSTAIPRLDPAEPRARPAPAAVEDRAAAFQALTHGNPEGARDFFRAHLEQQPEDHEARLALVRALRHLGEPKQAQAVLEAAPPSWVDPREVLAIALVWEDLGEPQQAIAQLLGGIHRHYSDEAQLIFEGEVVRLALIRGTDPLVNASVDRLYDAYDAGQAKSAETLLAVAHAAMARGTKGAFKDANMVLQEAESLAPIDDASSDIGDRIRLTRARMFAEKYAAQEALATLELLLDRDPWHPDALAAAAAVKADVLQFAEASRLAREALMVNPRHPVAHTVLAKVALIEGRRDEARTRVEDHLQQSAARGTSGPAIMAGLALMNSDPQAYAHWRTTALEFNPHNGAFFSELSDLLGFLHLYPEIEEILREAITVAPSDPYIRAARGLNLLRLGDEKTARQELEIAWKRDPFNERTRNVLDLYDHSIARDYTDIPLTDATLRLPHRDAQFIQPVIADSLTWSRAALDKAYGLHIPALRLEFFESASDFSIRTVGVPSLGAVAVCFGPVITFMGPYHGSHNIENVIRHELAHVYAIHHSRGRVPRWFTEGLSEWESELADASWARESAHLLQQARRAGKLRRLGELELAFIRAESPAMMEVAYATSAYAIRYLGQTYGRPALIQMLQGYGEGKTTDALTKEVLGRDFSAIEREFEQWFFAQLDARSQGWEPAEGPKQADKRDAMLQRATAQLEAGDFKTAQKTLELLVRSGGDGFVPRMRLAHLTAKTKQSSASEAHLQAARKFRPEAIDPWVASANLARKQDRIDDEKKYLRSALEIDGEAFEPAARLLLLAESSNDTAHADLARRRAQATAPLHPLTLAAQALHLHRQHDREAALAYAQRSVAALPQERQGPGDTWAMVALAAHAVGHQEDAERAAQAAVEIGGLPSATVQRLRAIAPASR